MPSISPRYVIDGEHGEFPCFDAAADYAMERVREHGEALIRTKHAGLLMADFRIMPDGEIAVWAIGPGKDLYNDWLRWRH